MRTQPPTLVILALVAGPLLIVARGAAAAEDQAHIDYRQKVMSSVGADMGGISDILKNGLPFSGNIAVHAARLEQSAALIAPAFEQRVIDGPTDAKPAIWEEPEKFQEAIAGFREAAARLRALAEQGDPGVRDAVKGLGQSCGGCHEPFRKPKEESYHNHP